MHGVADTESFVEISTLRKVRNEPFAGDSDRFAVYQNLARTRNEEIVAKFDESSFAGAVGAKQTDDFAGGNFEINILQDGGFAITFGKVMTGEEGSFR